MVGFYFALPFLLFVLLRLFVVLYNYFSRPYLPNGVSTDNPLVSILIYVQNSEINIGILLKGISNQTYQNYEVLIYNDQSTDKTIDVISEISAGDKRVRLFNGNDANNGWQRKNNAYEKLVQLSKGQYYIFVHSEFVIENQFIANAISRMQVKSLSLLAIYPKPQSQSYWVRIKISAAQSMFLSLILVKSFLRKRRNEGSIFTNPLLIIEATNYQLNRWFEKYNDNEAPEVQITDDIKSLNLEYEWLLGDNSLIHEVTDYNFEIANSSSGLIKGKNRLIAYALASTLGLFFAIFLLPFPLVFLYLLAIIYSRMLIALLCQQPVIGSLLQLPLQYIVMIQVLFKEIKKSIK